MASKKKFITLIAEKDFIDFYRPFGPVYYWPDLNKQNKSEIRKQADILVVGLKYMIDDSWIDEMSNLKVVATATTGLNHIDVNLLDRKGVKLISLRGQKSFLRKIPSTAEEALGLILALARNIPWAFNDVRDGRWNRDKWRGHQLAHKTLGILGFGRLGTMMARYGRALGMKVIACDPCVSQQAMKRKGVLKVEQENLFKNSDYVSMHVLLTDDTYDLVKEKHLRVMKPSAYLINNARAELIENGALLKALKNKWLAGAAIDVMWDERGDGSHLKTDPLADYAKKNNNLIIVPHIGGATFEAMSITQEFLANLVKKYLERLDIKKSRA